MRFFTSLVWRIRAAYQDDWLLSLTADEISKRNLVVREKSSANKTLGRGNDTNAVGLERRIGVLSPFTF